EEIAAARPGEKKNAEVTVGNIMSTRIFEELPAGGLEGRTRAMLKVEDGCVNFCSYCIIPYARGPVRSLPLEEAVTETRRLAEEGYREIVLTGIEISSWGQDLRNGQGPTDLIEAICAAAPGCRIRLGSLEPRTVTEDFCKRLSALPNLCPHFHLSLQSGCDATLKRMNRKYGTARYYESVTLLRQWFDSPGITTDLIVGFPGESEEEFGETLQFIEKCGFSAMHIFPYSRRPGTPADKMSGQVPKAVKEGRAHRAAALAGRMEENYLQSLAGHTLSVLFEEPVPHRPGFWRGHAPNYAEVWCESGENLHNQVRQVTVIAAGEGRLAGTLG
ncbi:MAG: MiaB/RimO family radical SAM methylthiotransferase, partial [Oscillospiraceae bacterium]|nr:MiaB/RimO family radical SAM methylthiotransferase [Oscillospiraceae bacterium]